MTTRNGKPAASITVLALAAAATMIPGLTTISVSAQIILDEHFIYRAGSNINAQNGGTGFDGPWVSTISHGRIFEIQSTGLSFSTLSVVGRSLSRYGSAGRAQAHRLVSPASQEALTGDGTTVWFSLLFQEPDSQYKHTSFLFGTEAFTTGGTPTLAAAGEGFGFTIQAAPDGSRQGNGTINALAFNGSTAPGVVAGAFTPDPIDATSLIVGKINWKASGTPDELFLFTVTDLSTEPLEGMAFASITDLDFDQSAFDTVALWDSNNGIVDEIRFGARYEDVVVDGADGDIVKRIETELLSALTALENHIHGIATLSPAEIEAHKSTIDAYGEFFGHNDAIIAACFDLVEAYDTVIGPLWIARGQFRRSEVVNDIHWTMYNVMQSIMDWTYTEENVLRYEDLLNGFKFKSSDHFPGAVDPPADPDATHTVTINGSYPRTFGHLTMHATRPARKPTGTYLAPGTIATITVPPSMAGKGYEVRVGAHSWDVSNRPWVRRLDRSSLTFGIENTQVKVASPLGGGIYVEVPYLADAGIVDVQIKNAVRSPFFSAKSFHATSLGEWRNRERHHQAPWADFQSEKFMMQVPTSWIYNLDDPVTLMEDWDAAMDATNDLMGYPHVRGKEAMYPQVDVIFRSSAHAPGYPSINVTYDPKKDYGGSRNYHLVTGPQHAKYYEFHEQGHGYLFQKFPGERESNVNLLHVAVWHRKFGYSLDESFRTSMGFNNRHRTLDNTAVAWMMCQNFLKKNPMAAGEKAYQLKGHAKFVEIARLFGWEVLGDYWRSFNDDHERNIRWKSDIDSLLLRLSRSVGVDITPLFHFWGVHPVNARALSAAIAADNLQASPEIYRTLVKYESLVPRNNAEYREFALNWWGKPPSPDGYWTERDHHLLWGTFDEDYSDVIKGNVQSIIQQYFTDSSSFIRADANGDQVVDISDGISTLLFLFLGSGGLDCQDAADVDDNGTLEVTDAIFLLSHIFLGGPAPKPPYPARGLDLTEDTLSCESYP